MKTVFLLIVVLSVFSLRIRINPTQALRNLVGGAEQATKNFVGGAKEKLNGLSQGFDNLYSALYEATHPGDLFDTSSVKFNIPELDEKKLITNLMLRGGFESMYVGDGEINEYIKIRKAYISTNLGKISFDTSGRSPTISLSVDNAVATLEIFIHWAGIKWTINPKITFSGVSASASMSNEGKPQVNVNPGTVEVELIDLNPFAKFLNGVARGEERLADILKTQGQKRLISVISDLMKKHLQEN